MKYIVIRADRGITKVDIPFIFPELLVHSDVAESMKHLLVMKQNWIRTEVISAGFIDATKSTCSGKSETLKVESRGFIDDALIANYGHLHGIVFE